MKLLYLHVVPINDRKANVIQVLHMCNAFQKIGIDVTLAIPVIDKKQIDVIEYVKLIVGDSPNFKIITVPHIEILGRSFQIISSISLLMGVKNKNKYDICFNRLIWTNCLSLVFFRNVIFESHESDIKPGSRIFNKICKEILIKCSLQENQKIFITISKALGKYWHLMGIPSRKLLVKHDGVKSENCEKVITISEARKYLNLSVSGKIVCYTGSLYKDRGIDEIFDLTKNFPNVSFIIVGGPEQSKKHYENKAIELKIKNIFFIGRVPHSQVKYFLAASNVLLLMYTDSVQTINICSPLKLFEYMAAERIIVGPGFQTIKEVLNNNKNALLSDPGDIFDLSSKLQAALAMNYPNHLSTNARIDVKTNYTWESRAKAILKELMKKKILS